MTENGGRVLAGRLSGCHGLTARDTSLPAIVALRPVADAPPVAAARRDLLASPLAAEADRAWAEAGLEGDWRKEAIASEVLRHPGTGALYVSVHAHAAEGCGGPDINFWGLYRVVPGGGVERLALRELGEVHSIERLVDLDGDGELELVGRDWLGGDLMLTGIGGEELDRIEVPFFGCPC